MALLLAKRKGGGALSNDRYAETTRSKATSYTRNFLNTIGKDDLFTVTEEDAERFVDIYEAQGKRTAALHQLAEMRVLFMNLVAMNKLKLNPLLQYTEKSQETDDDYIPQDQIDKVMEQSTVDWNDFFDVQSRVMCVVLYDFGLRISECTQLVRNDISQDDLLGITLRSEIQKWKRPQATLYHVFTQTYDIMKSFLSMRDELAPGIDGLWISRRGGGLETEGCRKMVKDHCRKLGIRTASGKTPTPHRFRHTFGTLNCEMGLLCWDIYKIQSRLRHSSLKTTIERYVTKNPLLERARHVATMNASNGAAQKPEQLRTFTTAESTNWISEKEAFDKLRDFSLVPKTLREFAIKGSFAKNADGRFLYSSEAVAHLAKDYVTKQQAMGMLGYSNGGFFDWYTRNCISPLNIGKVSLWQVGDIAAGVKQKST